MLPLRQLIPLLGLQQMYGTNHTVLLDTARGYNGTDKYIVFSHSLNGAFDQIEIDDFNYDTIPLLS